MPKWVITLFAVLAACSGSDTGTVTLYRNSPLDPSMRVHWATFDAEDGQDYNYSNCVMAARLLNANVNAASEAAGIEPEPGVGFWCESGKFNQEGMVPTSFDSEFPSRSPGPFSLSDCGVESARGIDWQTLRLGTGVNCLVVGHQHASSSDLIIGERLWEPWPDLEIISIKSS